MILTWYFEIDASTGYLSIREVNLETSNKKIVRHHWIQRREQLEESVPQPIEERDVDFGISGLYGIASMTESNERRMNLSTYWQDCVSLSFLYVRVRTLSRPKWYTELLERNCINESDPHMFNINTMACARCDGDMCTSVSHTSSNKVTV